MKQPLKEFSKNISLEKVAQFLLILTAFAPFIRTDFSLFPYVFGKAFCFFVLVSLAAICIGISALISPVSWLEKIQSRLRPLKSNKAMLLLGVYVVSLAVSTVFSKNTYVSFWGTFDRLEGFYQFLLYTIFAFLAALTFDKKQWMMYAKGHIVTVVVLCTVAWLERMGVSIPLPFVLNHSTQPGSLIGSSTFLASYLIVAGSYIATQIEFKSITKAYAKVAYIGLYVLIIATVIITGTKGAFLGLCAAVAIYLFLAVFNKKLPFKRRIAAALVILCCMGIIGLFIATRHNPLWLKIPTVTRFASLSANSNSLQSRLISWNAAVQGFQERWVIGWGPEEFIRVFNTYGSPTIERYTYGWFDRSHNKYLEVLVYQGALGFIIYIAMIGFIIRSLRYKPLALSFFGAYLIQNFFIFDTIVTYPIFVLFLAMEFQSVKRAETAVSKRSYIGIVRGFAILLIAACVYTVVLNGIVIKQQIAFHRIVNARSPEARRAQLNEILYPINPSQLKVRMQLLEYFLTALRPAHPIDVETFVMAAQAMEEVLPHGDGDPRYAVDLAEAYYYLRLVDRSFVSKAETYAQSILQQTPLAAKGYYLFILMSSDSRRYELSIDYARQAVALDEGNARAQLYLALTLISAGDPLINPYYYSKDKKFGEWTQEGHQALIKSYELASKRNDGSLAVTDNDFGDTQFPLLQSDEVRSMYVLALKFNEVELAEKIKRVADIFSMPLE